VRAQRVGVGPVLEEHEPQRTFHVAVNRVQQTSGLFPRTAHVGQAELEELVDRVGTGFDAAGDDEHGRTLATGEATYDQRVTVELNHTIVWCRDQHRSATFLAEILGRPQPTRFGPFLVVEIDNGVSLDYHETDGDIASQHYAFLIGETDFDEIFGRIVDRDLEYWADPSCTRRGEINRDDGGRGVYFADPDGHLLEIMTRPYGSGP
jgi:catechol 2,3-dioxygenase-like lactoylglutathione lyase family enzyme